MSDQTTPPTMSAYGRHVFICINGNCAPPEAGEAIRKRFMELNRKHHLNSIRNPERVKCTLSDCLGVCSGGPVLAVYPDGIWYHHVDQAALERIYTEHILGGQPVEDLIFHRLYPPGQEPGYAPTQRGDEPYQPPEGITPAPKSEVLRPTASTPSQAAEKDRTLIRRAKKKKGLVIVNTGNGKGKTTAALGVMTRAWGRKMKIGVIQFLKNENARFGEIKAAARMGNIDWISTGDGWTWTSADLDETQAKAVHAWEIAQDKIVNGGYDLFIMDEFTYIMDYGWLDVGEVVQWLRENKPPMLHLIITGRNAPPALLDFADLVTEMREIKHPLADQGIRAQPGIEY